MNVQG